MARLMRSCRLFWIALALSVLPVAAQNQHDMTFHTVPPCTVVDTRVAGGAFAAGETRTYNVVGSGSFASQGGSASGCGVPGFSNGIAQVQAVALNIVAFTPTGGGHIVANAADQALAGSVINFNANQNAANTTPVAVAQATGVGDFKILVNINSAHVLVRVFGYYSKPVQTVHVHPVPENHTASGTALLNAMAGITNASATKRYVIKLEPGIYDLGSTELTMKPYVDLEGSGQQATVIQGTGNNDSDSLTAIVQGAASSEIRDLQVKSTASSSELNSIAILVADGADTRIVDVTAVASGAAINWAIRNRNATVVIERSTLKAHTEDDFAYGINTKGPGSITTIKHSVIQVTTTTGTVYGVAANQGGAYTLLRDIQVTASASGSAYGIYLTEFAAPSDLRVTDSTITVEGGTGIFSSSSVSARLLVEQSQVRAIGAGGYGIQYLSAADVLIDHSEIAGETTVAAASAFIGATRLHGGPVLAGAATCAGVYDESFTFFAGPACP